MTENKEALSILSKAIEDKYKIEIYDLIVRLDEETKSVILSPTMRPVTDSRRKQLGYKK